MLKWSLGFLLFVLWAVVGVEILERYPFIADCMNLLATAILVFLIGLLEPGAVPQGGWFDRVRLQATRYRASAARAMPPTTRTGSGPVEVPDVSMESVRLGSSAERSVCHQLPESAT